MKTGSDANPSSPLHSSCCFVSASNFTICKKKKRKCKSVLSSDSQKCVPVARPGFDSYRMHLLINVLKSCQVHKCVVKMKEINTFVANGDMSTQHM